MSDCTCNGTRFLDMQDSARIPQRQEKEVKTETYRKVRRRVMHALTKVRLHMNRRT